MTSHPALRLAPASSGSNIRGLEITGFSSPTCCANVAISVDAETTDLIIAGNVLHNNLGGAILVAEPGPTGMPASGLRIGGPDAADRNVMYGYPGVNIVTLQACADCRLENNWFGIRTDNAPPAIVGNQTGLSLRETSNISVHDNWFGNSTRAISVSAMNDAVEIRHNLFGGAMRNLRAIDIHGTAAGFPINIDIEGNVITGQSFRGIAVSSEVAGNGVIGIRLRGNRLYGNGTLGFDLGNDGEGFAGLGSINPNDPGDGDMGPNGLQNSPVLGTPSQIGLVLEVPYALDSAPGDYLIEFSFATECSASHNALSGSMPRDPVAIETSELTGTALLQPFGIPAEGFVVAMATGSEGSSEFTACVPYSYSVSADIFRNGFEDAHGD